MNIYRVPHVFPDTLTHGFFGRQGGVSHGLYDSLNCSYQSGDLAEHIDENRLRVVRELRGQSLVTLKQIHSAICFPIGNSCMTGVEEGDALVTKTAGQVIGCLTADCAPVLLAGTDVDGAPVIGAAHAGWGGALKGVVESTVAAMVDLGAQLPHIKAAVGPCIAQASYEVGDDFSVPFLAEDPSCARYFHHEGGRVYFDLAGYVAFRLRRCGVMHVGPCDHDTYRMEDQYFSFRRATHRGERVYGRQISAIMIRKD